MTGLASWQYHKEIAKKLPNYLAFTSFYELIATPVYIRALPRTLHGKLGAKMNNSGWLVYVLAFLATIISCQGHRIDYETSSLRGVDDGRILLIARAEGIRVFTVGTNATSILRAPHRSD